MKLDQDKVPSTLDEAVAILKSGMDAKDHIEMRNEKVDAISLHFSLGMFLRNEWSLWDKNTILVKWFKQKYNIDHADDISGIILDSWFRDIKEKPRRVEKLVSQFLEHWKREGTE